MNIKRSITIGLVGAACAVGCSKKSYEGAATGTGAAAAAAPGTKLPGGMDAWMPKSAMEAWQGAWASRLTLHKSGSRMVSMAGDPAAIEIKGDKATVFDGTADHALGFVIDSPCSVSFKQPITEGSMAGGVASHGKQFLVRDGALLAGEGGVGYRKGKAAIVCKSGMDDLFTLDEAGTCLSWKERFGKRESSPTTCVWSEKDGKEILTLGTGDWASTLVAEGDVLMDEQFKEMVAKGYHQRATDFAAAKSSVAATIAAKAKPPTP